MSALAVQDPEPPIATWRLGTDLRKDDKYKWTFPNGRIAEYRSVVSILRPHFGEGFGFVQPYIVAKKAGELVEMAKAKRMHRSFSGWVLDESTGQFAREWVERDPVELLADTKWLRYEGDRYLGRAAHRGQLAHDLLPLWEMGTRMAQEDIKYWTPDRISQMGYLCDEDEACAYALALNGFLHEKQPVMRLTERPVFHDRLGYAGTEDGFWKFKGKPWMLTDVKTSKAVRPGFAEQLAAYFFAERIGHPTPQPVASGIRRKMPRASGAQIVLVQPDGVTVRRVKDIEAAWDSFKAVVKVFAANGNGPLFETDKSLRYKTGSSPVEGDDDE